MNSRLGQKNKPGVRVQFRKNSSCDGSACEQNNTLTPGPTSRLVQAGVDLYTVQRLGRWKCTKMVQHYGHHYPESLRGGAEVLDRLRAEASTKITQSEGSARVATA
jgi:hypothetical protein